ncbi:MAG TPA: hypothetical protein VGF28_00935 [Thermoanaerobaculia bacterium]|jgi:hypothetical protein
MPELNIYFFGLICHVDENSSGTADFAALVRAPNHEPRILLGPKESESFELQSDVTFADTASAAIDKPDFDKHVPKLKSILGGTLEISRNDAWRVYYPQGDGAGAKLTVADTYPCTARHRSKVSKQTKRQGAVARLVRLRVPLNAAKITVEFNGKAREIDSDSCILIANVENTYLFNAGVELEAIGRELSERAEKRTDMSEWTGFANRLMRVGGNISRAARAQATLEPNHFEYYSMLVAGGDTAIAEPVSDAERKPLALKCKWVADIVGELEECDFPRGAARPECGNTNWP